MIKTDKRVLGRGMSEEARERDVEQSDREYLRYKQEQRKESKEPAGN